MAQTTGNSMVQVCKTVSVCLEEAAIDSPTFRSIFVHFVENVEALERWLETYLKSVTKLANETSGLETLFSNFFSQSAVPLNISEAVLDHDYTLLALERYGEGAHIFWSNTLRMLRKMESNIVEPIRNFIQRDLRKFKDLRRKVEQSQKHFDGLQSRFTAQAKTKEASSLREDAFTLHESRKIYMRAAMDFSEAAPQLRLALDKLLIKAFSNQWEDMRQLQHGGSGPARCNSDIVRVRGWVKALEGSEIDFRGQLSSARRELEKGALMDLAPSRELEDYSTAFASFHGGLSVKDLPNTGPEKHGWLNLRSVVGKPSRTIWIRRWFFIRHGLFGWLTPYRGAVQESEAIGVLLCSAKPANSEERRFCFEIKTKDRTLVVQAETRPELIEWLGTFEFAKQKALEKPSHGEMTTLSQDYAFAIVPPASSEFAAEGVDPGTTMHDEAPNAPFDRSNTLPVPGSDIAMSLASRSSFDVASMRRGTTSERDPDSTREKIIQKLDLHRKPMGVSSIGGSPAQTNMMPTGGIASLINASHSVMPISPGAVSAGDIPGFAPLKPPTSNLPRTSLAPVTLASPPASTNLSTTAVVINGEQGFGRTQSRSEVSDLPTSILANIWGSVDRGLVGELYGTDQIKGWGGEMPSSTSEAMEGDTVTLPVRSSQGEALTIATDSVKVEHRPSSSPMHRKVNSLDAVTSVTKGSPYPDNYPIQLKTQEAQFRLLYPDVRTPEDKLLMVFRASWNFGTRFDYPGRVYVTGNTMYFYSNHLGQTSISRVRLASITEITAATGRECDFLYLHLVEPTVPGDVRRITIKLFLDEFRLLQRRLQYLREAIHGSAHEDLKSKLKALINLEEEETKRAKGLVSSNAQTTANSSLYGEQSDSPDISPWSATQRLKTTSMLQHGPDRHRKPTSDEKDGMNFRLPRQAVIFEPPGMGSPVMSREYEISPKALYHVLFGDKSVVWQLLYQERQAQRIKQGSWTQPTAESHVRREFEYEVIHPDALGRARQAKVQDYQMIDVANDHLCYVVTDRRSGWHLPYHQSFQLLSKIVITHVAKSRCRLAIFTAIDWLREPPLLQRLIERQARKDLDLDANDLADVVSDQVRKLGAHSRTRKAVQIFGQIGQQKQHSELTSTDMPPLLRSRRSMRRRTMLALALESTGSILESIAAEAAQIMIDACRWIWGVTKAQYLLLFILTISLISNLLASSTFATEWWTERRALRLVTSLESQAVPVVDKVVYAPDINIFATSDPLIDEPEEKAQSRW